jgi:hypothetical protein
MYLTVLQNMMKGGVDVFAFGGEFGGEVMVMMYYDIERSGDAMAG